MIVENFKIERNMDSRGLNHKISEQNHGFSVGKRTRDHSRKMMSNNLTVVCCPGNANKMIDGNERWHDIQAIECVFLTAFK